MFLLDKGERSLHTLEKNTLDGTAMTRHGLILCRQGATSEQSQVVLARLGTNNFLFPLAVESLGWWPVLFNPKHVTHNVYFLLLCRGYYTYSYIGV